MSFPPSNGVDVKVEPLLENEVNVCRATTARSEDEPETAADAGAAATGVAEATVAPNTAGARRRCALARTSDCVDELHVPKVGAVDTRTTETEVDPDVAAEAG